MNTLQDRIRGSFIGGAASDALGYPVEFLKDFKKIRDVYGENGITKLTPPWAIDGEKYDKALISDDTQMTLFTANGILNAKRQKIGLKYGICLAYVEWYLTQIGKWSNRYKDCWIARIPEMNHRRGPGHTCMSSLYAIYKGHDPINDSKGDGGVMRVAPIPLYSVVDNRMSITDAARLAGEAAENHAGDSDSTGAITGNILGAAIGYDAIPQKFKDDLELHDVILHMADDIYRGEITKM